MPPKKSTTVIDHDDDGADLAAAVAETTGDAWSIEFDGHTYTVSPSVFDTIEYVEAVQDNHDTAMVRAMLGRAQWELFKSRHPKRTALIGFSEALGKQVGSGNS